MFPNADVFIHANVDAYGHDNADVFCYANAVSDANVWIDAHASVDANARKFIDTARNDVDKGAIRDDAALLSERRDVCTKNVDAYDFVAASASDQCRSSDEHSTRESPTLVVMHENNLSVFPS